MNWTPFHEQTWVLFITLLVSGIFSGKKMVKTQTCQNPVGGEAL
jgi:hypothetical protein